jgi:hypothetical protein
MSRASTMVHERGAEFALGAAMVAVFATWRYHSHKLGVAPIAGGVDVVETTIEMPVRDVGDSETQWSLTSPDIPDNEVPPIVVPVQQTATDDEDSSEPVLEELAVPESSVNELEEQKQRDKAKQSLLLGELHNQLAMLGTARDDGWSALFVPLPSSETQERKEAAKQGIIARIRAIQAST